MKKILFLLCCVVLISCEKNSQDLILNNIQDQTVPQFSSLDEAYSSNEMLKNMNRDERIEWENTNGFKSFHTKCEEVYALVRDSKLETMEEVFAKVSEYSEYLQILEDDGEFEVENVLYNSIYKYIIDENRFFRTKNMVYKVFEQAIVGTNESNIQSLRDLSGEEISTVSTDPAFDVIISTSISYKKDAAYDAGRSDDDVSDKRKYDGRYRRVKLEIDVIRTKAMGITRIDYQRIITPQQRIAWIWWRYTVPNVSADMDVRVDYELSPAGSPVDWDDEQVTEILSENNSDRIFENDIIYQSVYEENLDYHFGGYDCKATTSHIGNYAIVRENYYIL